MPHSRSQLRSQIQRLAVYLATAFACLFAVACDDEPGTKTCPDGRSDGGECIQPTDDASEAGSDTTDTDASDDLCTPGSFRCADTTTRQTCRSDGRSWEEQACGQGLVCDDGRCISAEMCEPGEPVGCASATAREICAANGVDSHAEACPADRPNCFDGQCIEGRCAPGALFCEGDELRQCNGSGDDSTLTQNCAHGCSSGTCLAPPDEACSDKSYIGCDFWAVDLDNYTKRCSTRLDCSLGACIGDICVDEDANDQQFAVTVSNMSDREVHVEVIAANNTISASVDVAARELQRIQLRARNVLDTSLTRQTYRVRADGPVTVHQFNPESNLGVFSNDASLLLPTNALGTEYRVIGWPTLEQPSLATFPSTNKAYVTIVAAEPGQTRVTVETPVDIQAGDGVQSISAGSTKSFTLDQGMVLQLATIADSSREYDLTGLSVMSSRKVAVFSGHECAFVPTDTPACDHLEQQLMPETTWGTNYVVPKFAPRGREVDMFRVVAADDDTTLTTKPPIDGVHGEAIDSGQSLEFDSDISFSLSATNPVSVAQFMVGALYPGPLQGCDPANGVEYGCLVDTRAQCEVDGDTFEFPIGDPAFTLNVPTSQFRSDYVVLTPEGYQDDYVSIVAPSSATLSVDGQPVEGTRNTIPDTEWDVIWVEVSPGTHNYTADQPFGLYAYGYECFVSYAYPGGLNLGTDPT